MNATQISAAKTAELLAFFNANTLGKPVAKFADRKTAERRVSELVKLLAPKNLAETGKLAAAYKAGKKAMTFAKAAAGVTNAGYVVGTCPSCGESADITCGTNKNGTVVREHEALCHGCGHEFNYNTGKALKARTPSATLSEAIAKSWTDPTVAAARAERHHVVVGGVEYRSVAHAFTELALPMEKHIAFRGQLKAAGKLAFQGKVFKLVAKQ